MIGLSLVGLLLVSPIPTILTCIALQHPQHGHANGRLPCQKHKGWSQWGHEPRHIWETPASVWDPDDQGPVYLDEQAPQIVGGYIYNNVYRKMRFLNYQSIP